MPDDYRESALVVLKGSWNRNRKSGYKVVSLHWIEESDGTTRIEEREFIAGFERDENVIGRPVDVVAAPDGSLYVSDDMAGAIYRIRYVPEAVAERGGVNENVFALPVEVPAVTSDPLEGLGTDELQALFDRHGCATCHAASGSREAAVPLRDLAVRRSLEDVVRVLRSPPASMPRVLQSDEEREALAVYLLGREERAPLISTE